MRLEAYQLAESVIAVSAKREICITKHSSSKKRRITEKQKQIEYLLVFDHSLGIKPIWFDSDSTNRLSAMRMEQLPGFDTITPTIQSKCQTVCSHLCSPSRTPSANNSHLLAMPTRSVKPFPIDSSVLRPCYTKDKKDCSNRERSSIPPLKQLGSLIEEKIIGRTVNFSVYEMCHHCKQLKPITSHLLKCGYSSLKNGTAVPTCITIKGARIYNGIFSKQSIVS